MSEHPSDDPAPPPAAAAPSPEEKLSGEMLMLTTGLMMCAAALWLAVYWSLGYRFSSTIPLLFQVASALTIAAYWKYRRLKAYALVQLGLILFTPFVMQWSIGSFVTASGVSLWALLAPVGALTVLGTRESTPWFFAWLFLTLLSGVFDYVLGSGQKVDLSTLAVFFALNFTAISVMIYALLWYFAHEKQRLRGLVDATLEEVRAEQARAEKLLLNILPPAIAGRLKQGEVNIAQGHADVTVMFADIVGFTRMTEELAPAEVVQALNDLFSLFDGLADRHGVEKVKTIGDAYMAASGLDDAVRVHSADAMAHFALDMLRELESYCRQAGRPIALRIGIATGPVVAGVIGRRKFIYDLWGDTVNTAFRMGADAPPGHIRVDPVTHRRLQQRFQFEALHGVEVKGKGRMDVFHLRGRAAVPEAQAP